MKEPALKLGQQERDRRVSVGVDDSLSSLESRGPDVLALVREGLQYGVNNLSNVRGKVFFEDRGEVDEEHHVAVLDVRCNVAALRRRDDI